MKCTDINITCDTIVGAINQIAQIVSQDHLHVFTVNRGEEHSQVIYKPAAKIWIIGYCIDPDIDGGSYQIDLDDICRRATAHTQDKSPRRYDTQYLLYKALDEICAEITRSWSVSTANPDADKPKTQSGREMRSAYSWVDFCYGNKYDYSGADWEAEVPGSALKSMRRISGVTQAEIAKWLDVSQAYISKIEGHIAREGMFNNYVYYIEEYSDKASDILLSDMDLEFAYQRIRNATQADIDMQHRARENRGRR